MSWLSKSLKERVCDVCVLSSRSSEPEKQDFKRRFPYWERSFASILDEASEKAVGFLSWRSYVEVSELQSRVETTPVSRWVVANAYDEWSNSWIRFSESQVCPVDWIGPDWPPASGDSGLVEKEPHVLLIGDRGTSGSLLEDFILDSVETFRDLPLRSLILERLDSPGEALDRVAKASACVSLIGDRQMEHWLYLKALDSGCECWVSAGDYVLDERYLGDFNSNRILIASEQFAKLRPFFRTMGALNWTGRLNANAYDRAFKISDAHREWLLARSKTACAEVNGLLPRDSNSGFELGTVVVVRELVGIHEALGGNADLDALGPLLDRGLSSRRDIYRCLASRDYSSEWAETFLYRIFRDEEFLTFSLNEAKSSRGFSEEGASRARAKIGRALLELARLSIFGYDEALLQEALSLLGSEFEGGIDFCGDLLGGLGLACSLSGEEERLEEYANEYLTRFPRQRDFFLPIGEHWLRAGSCQKGLHYLRREEEANGPCDWVLCLKVDAHCRLGNREEAVRTVESFSDRNMGLARVATLPLREAWIWDSKEATISKDELQAYLEICDQVEDADFLVNRAAGIYALHLEDWERAEKRFCRALEIAPKAESDRGQLRMNLARLEVDPKRFKGKEFTSSDSDWVRSLDDALVYAIMVAIEGRADQIQELKSIGKRLSRLSKISNQVEAFAVRCHALTLMNLTGNCGDGDRDKLARRILPKFGRSLDQLPDPLLPDRLAAWESVNGEMATLCREACVRLEPWFLDV